MRKYWLHLHCWKDNEIVNSGGHPQDCKRKGVVSIDSPKGSKSCLISLTAFHYVLAEGVNKERVVLVAYLDFSKAFGTVSTSS